ncbi:MAG TPA: oligopeptide/dipeptide ABC transporter ATP-binding protein [Herpetosiphonaceae bacterium]
MIAAQPATQTAEALLTVEGLTKYYPVRKGMRARVYVRAVDGVSFTIRPGETLGLVGESGSGKSTIGRCILRLEEPTAGRIWFAGQEVTGLAPRALRAMRRHAQIVFQDPYDALNPRMTVSELVTEPLLLHKLCSRREASERAKDLLAKVGLKQVYLNRYPHQLSGGQNQRVGIARALATGPRLLVLDEPTSALDVSVQAKLLNLLGQLQADLGLSYLFISHDLAVVNYLAARVAVLYLGQIVEIGTRNALFATPRHPYTQALMSALPSETPEQPRQRIVLAGEIPSAINPPQGCRLASRCPYATSACRELPQPLRPIEAEHLVACHRALAGELP